MAPATFSMENPIFSSFATYASLVILKTMAMSGVTAFQRFKNKAFANEEDAVNFKTGKQFKPMTHPAVERVRRCHLNDLENVIPFVLLGSLYVASGPSQWAALMHFRIFTVARFLHTIVYIGSVPQPARALTFFVGLITCISMGVNVLQSSTF